MNPNDVKEKIEELTGIDVSSGLRVIGNIRMKATYCKICRDFLKTPKGFQVPYQEIGNPINLNYQTVRHHCENTAEAFIRDQVACKMAYDYFKELIENPFSEDNYPNFEYLYSKISKLENEVKSLKKGNENKLTSILNKIPAEHQQELINRVEFIAGRYINI